MALAPGTRLGPYEIGAPLGAGGMGEVYRARDTRLKRQVAIKVLPEGVAQDPDRLARFQREAELLATLNHPHIAGIYGLEESNGVAALVMELVDGPTLAARIAHGAIPIDEALPIARQIADALEAAHDHGIVHRDLKPANIALTAEGDVKVLDFGLAKATDTSGTSRDLTDLSTLTSPAMLTAAGVILGTAAYMSPEQTKGRAADKRSDVWAYGCVLYEMLTGRRAFGGKDATDVIAAIIRAEPDWSALPSNTPTPIRRLLGRCLEKDRQRRLADAADARLDIDDAIAHPTAETPARGATSWRRVVLVAIAALATGALIARVVVWPQGGATRLPQVSRFGIVQVAPLSVGGNANDRNIVISPDGARVVYAGGSGGTQLIVRSLDQLDAGSLPGISNARSPFLSPDGRWVGFFSPGELKKVSITGGPAISLCRVNGLPRGASWGADDTIVFATNDPTTGLLSVPAGGGEPTVLTTPDVTHGEGDHVLPSVLLESGAIFFTIVPQGPVENSQVAVLDRQTGQRKILVRGGSQAEYGDTGHLLYAAAGTLRAVRFDRGRLAVTSDPVPLVEHVLMSNTGAANYSLSRTGTLAYLPGGATGGLRSLVWVDRLRQEAPIGAPPRVYVAPRLSPDGTRVALEIRDQEQDIWTWDFLRQTLTRLTFDPALDASPIWTPDGRRIIFSSLRNGAQNLFWQPADGVGKAEQLTKTPNLQFVHSISPDGARVILREATASTTGVDLLMLTLGASGEREAQPLVKEPKTQINGEISPDGHWLAYQSDESGQNEIYVRPFPNVTSGRWQISPAGGTRPAWTRNGRELLFLNAANLLTAVPVTTSPTLSVGNPTKVLEIAYYTGNTYRTYDVSPDGKRFLMIKDAQVTDPQSASAPPSIVVVLNWLEELKARVPTK